jgi:hypothetical protein
MPSSSSKYCVSGSLGKMAMATLVWLIVLTLVEEHHPPNNTKMIPSTLQLFQMPSAFEAGLYHAHHEPFRSNPCQPHKIHLAQATNMNDQDRVDMTVSFALDYVKCPNAQPTILYGQGLFPQGSVTMTERVQFQYASTTTGEMNYQSDWIHHMRLPDLVGGRHRYWYRIVVHGGDTTMTSATSATAAASTATATTTAHDAWASNTVVASGHRVVFLRGSTTHAVLGETPLYSFRTPPLAQQPTSLALVGDLGQTENSTKTMNHILDQTTRITTMTGNQVPPVSALLIAGDLSYSDGDPHRWERWLELMVRLYSMRTFHSKPTKQRGHAIYYYVKNDIQGCLTFFAFFSLLFQEPLLRTTPLYASTGNHEIECDNRTHDIFVPYENYFRNPNRIRPADMEPVADDYRKTLWHEQCTTNSELLGHYNFGNAFYSVTHGLAQVLVLNSYTDTLPGSVQYHWLDAELQRVDRTRTPWLIVMFHCPLHTTFLGHNGEINPALMMKAMEPLFVQYQVNFIVSGHDHGFLRTKPMVGTNVAEDGHKGPIYLTLGAGGNREQHSGYLHETPEEWVEKRDHQEYGYGHMFLANDTHAHFRWVRDGTTDEGIRDDVWLENQYIV